MATPSWLAYNYMMALESPDNASLCFLRPMSQLAMHAPFLNMPSTDWDDHGPHQLTQLLPF